MYRKKQEILKSIFKQQSSPIPLGHLSPERGLALNSRMYWQKGGEYNAKINDFKEISGEWQNRKING